MMSETPTRPNPDELLARLHAEEEQQARGKLNIFLGYAAGVGKTYAMLEVAHQRKTEGVDVVIAYVETHLRAETEALVAGLEVIPRKQIEYRGTQLTEMDVDAVLARNPQLALVDELAHTNAPGARHPKRYQDVEELLAAGISVYTTLNIQHLESLRDVVAQITGVTVHETLPDSILDLVTEIELIDLSPDELLQRLKEGKVYVPDQAARAIQQFFRRGNLTALREIAMRRAAERVDYQMRTYMRARAISGPWPASERLLVCVSPSPLGERLVRTARRLADNLHAEWFALYVETPDQAHLSSTQRERVAHTLQLAEELGARTRVTSATSVPEAVIAYAHKHNVTKIIAGKPFRAPWREWLQGSVVDQIIRGSGDIDVYVISGDARKEPPEKTARRTRIVWWRYMASVTLVTLATLISVPIHRILTPSNLVMVYLAAVMFAAVFWGRGPSMLAAFLSVLAFDFFFVPPSFTFAVSDTRYLLTFIGFFVVGLVISYFATRASQQAQAAQRREEATASLYAFSRELNSAVTLGNITSATVAHLSMNFDRDVVVLLSEEDGLAVHARSPKAALDDNEMAVAAWAFQQGRPAGRDTDTLPAARVRYLPLKTPRGVVGVLGVEPPTNSIHLTAEQRQQMETFASQAALAIERVQLAEQARCAQVAQTTEKLQTALLNSISHDLRTPLATITGVLSTLSDEEAQLDENTRRSLTETATQEAERLNRLVGNLLDMTRLEAGALRLMLEPCDVADVIGAALEQLSKPLRNRQVLVNVPPELPLVPMGFVLIQQVLVNLLDNALKYSPPDTPIEVNARLVDQELEIAVSDHGVGIPPGDLERVFDKLYRVQRPGSVAGSGLGLAICKGIVGIHGGSIWAQNRPGGGTIMTVALPLQRQVGGAS
jgi:two-component system, OmpR family, sensor histidine kinase KdpD